MGRDVVRDAPIDMAWLHPDRDIVRPVYLVITHASYRNHWAINWEMAPRIGADPGLVRRIHVVRERVGHRELSYLTNWGPITGAPGSSPQTTHIPLAKLSLKARRALEAIAIVEEVFLPERGTEWDCQDWLTSVLLKAVHQGIISKEQVRVAVNSAKSAPTAVTRNTR